GGPHPVILTERPLDHGPRPPQSHRGDERVRDERVDGSNLDPHDPRGHTGRFPVLLHRGQHLCHLAPLALRSDDATWQHQGRPAPNGCRSPTTMSPTHNLPPVSMVTAEAVPGCTRNSAWRPGRNLTNWRSPSIVTKPGLEPIER